MSKKNLKRVFTAIVMLFIASAASGVPNAQAFWLLNFQTASTLPAGGIGFIGGTGGQFTSVGDPRASSFTPFLAHAGIRFGLMDGLDIGYRLCTVPLPYSSAGPSLGAETDLKWRISPISWDWQVGLIGGIGYSYLLLSGQSKNAWAPGGDLILTHRLTDGVDLSWNARYVYTGISSVSNSSNDNHVQAVGGGMGAKFALTPSVSILPEVGVFDFTGNLAGTPVNGWGLQYGVVLSARFR